MNIHPDVREFVYATVVQDPRNLDTFPRLYRFFDSDQLSGDRESKVEKQIASIESRLSQTLNSARQIFAVAVDCVQQMSIELKDKLTSDKDLAHRLENYKITLGKYQGILLQDLKAGAGPEKTAAFCDAVVSEHKNRLIQIKDGQGGFAMHVDNVVDVILSLRINALQQPK